MKVIIPRPPCMVRQPGSKVRLHMLCEGGSFHKGWLCGPSKPSGRNASSVLHSACYGLQDGHYSEAKCDHHFQNSLVPAIPVSLSSLWQRSFPAPDLSPCSPVPRPSRPLPGGSVAHFLPNIFHTGELGWQGPRWAAAEAFAELMASRFPLPPACAGSRPHCPGSR